MKNIFTASKYYEQAKANPIDVAPPIGYEFLNHGKNKQIAIVQQFGQLQLKQVFDRPHYKVLSQKRTPLDKLPQFLKISKLPRKIQYIPPTLLQMMRNSCQKQLFLKLSHQFVPHFKPQYSVIELSQILANPRIQSASHIQDYSLSRFYCTIIGSDPFRVGYLFNYFNRRVIQYNVECQIINHNRIDKNDKNVSNNNFISFIDPPRDIENPQEVSRLIDEINQKNTKSDPLYSGVHFLFADFTNISVENQDYFQRQNLHYSTLQYVVTLLTGILGDGQSAVIKFQGVVQHKTFQFIWILKLLFGGKVSLNKNLGSNPFLPELYVVCEHFNKQNGLIIQNYLLENYTLFKDSNGESFLIDPKRLVKQDLSSSVRSFNQTVIRKGIQFHLKQFKANMNTQYYPSKYKISQKLPKYAPNIQGLIKQMIRLPDKLTVEQKYNRQVDEMSKNQGKRESPINVHQSHPTTKSSFVFSSFSKKKNIQNAQKK